MKQIIFTSAYDQLQPSEMSFVDGFIDALSAKAAKAFERITVALAKFSETVDPETIDSRSLDMFAKPLVSAAIVERVRLLALDADLSPEWILRKQKVLASANMADFTDIGEDGYLRPNFVGVTHEQMGAVKSFKFREKYTRGGSEVHFEFALHDPQVALGQLSKHTGLEKAENPIYAQYAALPEATHLPAQATTAELGEAYARRRERAANG